MGLFEEADGGTIFLDEIGDVSAALRQGRASDTRTIRVFRGSDDSKEYHF